MASTSLNLIIFLALFYLSLFLSNPTFFPTTITTDTTSLPLPPPQQPPLFTTSPSPQPPQDRDSPNQSIFSHTSDLAPILSHLGFFEPANFAPTLFSNPAVAAVWSGLYTLFAPSDSYVLTFGTKIETLSPGRCITITSSTTVQKDLTVYKIFIGGVEITHPDLFNNGMIIIHGLQGYISHLSSFSCNMKKESENGSEERKKVKSKERERR